MLENGNPLRLESVVHEFNAFSGGQWQLPNDSSINPGGQWQISAAVVAGVPYDLDRDGLDDRLEAVLLAAGDSQLESLESNASKDSVW